MIRSRERSAHLLQLICLACYRTLVWLILSKSYMHVSNTAAASAIIQRYICRGVGSRSTLVSHMLALLSIRALHDLLVNQIIQVLFRLCLVLIPQELHQ